MQDIPSLQFRVLTAPDLSAARILWAATEGVELSAGDEVHELTGYLQRNPGMSYAAFDEGQLVGALLAGHDGRRGFIYHLAVAPQQRGRGIGRELVARSLSSLKEHGVVRVLILVARDNPNAFSFWRHQGWESLDFAEPMGIDL